MPDTIGIIAGESVLPLISIREARKQGMITVVAGIRTMTLEAVQTEADHYAEFSLGQTGKFLRFFQAHSVHRAIMVGRVRHPAIFSHLFVDMKFFKLMKKVRDRTTTSLLSAVADFFQDEGIDILDSTTFLKEYLVEERFYTPKREIRPAVAADIEFGWKKAWGIASLDIGQTVCVKGRAVVAVEAMEGTDRTILRAGEIAGPGIVAVKVSRPGHDMRFDVPVIGAATMSALVRIRAAALVLEARRTLMLDREPIVAMARENKISLLGKA